MRWPPQEEDQRPTSIITRQCIEEIVGPVEDEAGITSLGQLTDRVEEIFVEMGESASRWQESISIQLRLGGAAAAAGRRPRSWPAARTGP